MSILARHAAHRLGLAWLVAGSLTIGVAAFGRVWVRASGETFEATFLQLTGRRVIMAGPGGTRFAITLDELCDEDQRRILALASGRTPPPETPPEARATQRPATSLPPSPPAPPSPAAPSPRRRGEPSRLWGASGELWRATSRLPDFSFAGYRHGEATIPTVPVTTDVRRHGARGDGVTDDTAAFRRAIDATPHGAILVPAGRYVLTDVVTLRRGGVVLRGEGPDRSVLVCPKSFTEIRGRSVVDGFKSRWAFSGGFVTLEGGAASAPAAKVVAPARRGERTLVLDDASAFPTGSYLRLTMASERSLGRHLHGDRFEAGAATFEEMQYFMDWVARIVAREDSRVTLDRPLRLDVRPEWDPRAWVWQPTAEDMGVEHLSFEFPGTPKKAHLLEEGFNALQLRGVVNGWVRNVSFVDCDNGVILSGCRFVEVSDVRFVARRRKDPSGHHALWVTGYSQDCLLTRFEIATVFEHDLSVEGLANGNVFSAGRARRLTCDHHANIPYENLFTDIDAGDPQQLYRSGGRDDRGPKTGVRTTFWNIRGSGEFPRAPDWPLINLIGVGSGPKLLNAEDGPWIEPLKPVWPPNLHTAQRERRLTQRASP
ncbi:MAG: glycoside hydrolase family 55 protein [Kiritimatiellae bacterium]|nr:glycoside hydrolase family 55 protein [Kiritimatiellia bacterium]